MTFNRLFAKARRDNHRAARILSSIPPTPTQIAQPEKDLVDITEIPSIHLPYPVVECPFEVTHLRVTKELRTNLWAAGYVIIRGIDGCFHVVSATSPL